ncbi:MAG: glycosyltransferase family 4 protein [Candidatus Hodarchaeota archaeon]
MSPPDGGEGIAFRMLVEHLRENSNYELILIDKVYRQGLKVRRFLNPIRVVLKTINSLFKNNITGLYLTCGQTFGGIIRDAFVIGIGKFSGIPVIMHLHGGGIHAIYQSKSMIFQRLMVLAYRQATKIIVLGDSLLSQFSFLDDQSVLEVIPNAYGCEAPDILVDNNFYDELKSNKKFNLLYLSNVLPSKGLFDVLETCLQMKSTKIPFEFHFAGEVVPENKWSKNKIENVIQNYQKKLLDTEFIIHGFVTGTKKWNIIKRAHVFILPTHYHFEGQPISVIEAMYGGCCVLATAYRGIPDILKESKNGWYITTGNTESIVSRLKWLWKHPEKLKQIGISNHFEAKEKYSTSVFQKRMLTLFQEVFL